MAHIPFDDELSEAEQAQLAAFLDDPAVWEEPSLDDEDVIVAAILAESAATSAPVPTIAPVSVPEPATAHLAEPTAGEDGRADNVIEISRARRFLAPVAAGIAAAVIVLAGFGFVSSRGDNPEGVLLALEGTEVAPDASAEAVIAPLRSGTRIVLDVSGLQAAEPGTYYEAWMRKDAAIGVSAGTFHLRGGDDTIELWSGVTPEDYPLITITLQTEAQTESSGVVVLKGLLNPSDFAD